MKYIGVAFSDLHTNDWKQFNRDGNRLRLSVHIMNEVISRAVKYDCPILFPGDLNHNPDSMSNSVLQIWGEINRTNNQKIIGINGNHDFDKINSFKSPKRGYLHHLMDLGSNISCIDFSSTVCPGYTVHGIPYINGNSDFMEALEDRVVHMDGKTKNILLIHRDLPGAIEPNGKRIGEDHQDIRLRKLLSKFTLVLAGHIHKPQRLKLTGKNVYMLGSPYQQRRSDADCPMGIWLIKKDFSMKFIPLDLPKFRYYREGELPDNETDFWIKLPKETKIDKDLGKIFSASKDRGELVKQYFKVKGIKNKTRYNLLMELIND